MVSTFFFLMIRRPPRSTLFPYTTILQPRQSLLAGGALHQGRPDRVLPDRIQVDAALSRRSAPGAHALPRRYQREVIFPEGRAGVCPGVRPNGHDLERGLAARPRLFRVRQRVLAPLHRQHGGDPAPRLVVPRRPWRSPTGASWTSIRR